MINPISLHSLKLSVSEDRFAYLIVLVFQIEGQRQDYLHDEYLYHALSGHRLRRALERLYTCALRSGCVPACQPMQDETRDRAGAAPHCSQHSDNCNQWHSQVDGGPERGPTKYARQ